MMKLNNVQIEIELKDYNWDVVYIDNSWKLEFKHISIVHSNSPTFYKKISRKLIKKCNMNEDYTSDQLDSFVYVVGVYYGLIPITSNDTATSSSWCWGSYRTTNNRKPR